MLPALFHMSNQNYLAVMEVPFMACPVAGKAGAALEVPQRTLNLKLVGIVGMSLEPNVFALAVVSTLFPTAASWKLPSASESHLAMNTGVAKF